MDEREKKSLRLHKENIAAELVAAERTMDVIYELQEQGVLDEKSADTLLNLETTKTAKMRSMICCLETRGAGVFSKFMEVLLKLGLAHLVKTLDPTTYEKHRGSISGKSDELDDLQRLPHTHNGYVGLQLPRPPAQDPSRIPKMPENGDAENNNPEEPMRIRVIPYRELGGRELPPSEVYRNRSMPRGLVFLANYKDFLNEERTTRVGSEIDVKNLSLLFSQMGYKIPKQYLNMTKYETITALREFRALRELSEVDSCIVIIMSHGHDERSFYTSDNQYLSVNDVVERFSNKECPALQGKPKIFIFQYCRGSGPDVGIEATPHQVRNRRGLIVHTDSAGLGEALVHRDPTYTDMYIIYSTVEGFVSFRHPERGSWLMEAICHVFMNNACSSELSSLMKMVSRKVRENYTDDGSKQVCELVQRAFDRHFYFNPEPLNAMGSLNMNALSRVLSESTGSLEGAASPVTLSPTYRRRVRSRNVSRSSTPELSMNDNYSRNRHRNLSGASNASEKSLDELDPLDLNSKNAAVHPRVRSLSGTRTRRRISLPDPISFHQSTYLNPHESWNRSFSEHAHGSRGTTPDPSESPVHAGSGNDVFLHISEPELESPMEGSFDIVDNLEMIAGSAERVFPETNSGGTSPGQNTGSAYSTFWKTEEQKPSPRPEEQHGICHSQSSTTIRPKYDDEEPRDPRFSFKRQLSVPSTKETLEKINDVRKYLQVHDSDPQLLTPLQRIESFVNKKKYEGKRRRVENQEPASLEY